MCFIFANHWTISRMMNAFSAWRYQFRGLDGRGASSSWNGKYSILSKWNGCICVCLLQGSDLKYKSDIATFWIFDRHRKKSLKNISMRIVYQEVPNLGLCRKPYARSSECGHLSSASNLILIWKFYDSSYLCSSWINMVQNQLRMMDILRSLSIEISTKIEITTRKVEFRYLAMFPIEFPISLEISITYRLDQTGMNMQIAYIPNISRCICIFVFACRMSRIRN